MKRYLDYCCPRCNFLGEFFTEEEFVDCPKCRVRMDLVWRKPPGMGDPHRLGISKPPSDFDKYVLGRIKEKHPYSNIEYRRSLAKEI